MSTEMPLIWFVENGREKNKQTLIHQFSRNERSILKYCIFDKK